MYLVGEGLLSRVKLSHMMMSFSVIDRSKKKWSDEPVLSTELDTALHNSCSLAKKLGISKLSLGIMLRAKFDVTED